jgi:hypothetical protein
MTDDGQAQEVHATVTDVGDSQELANGGQARRPDLGSDKEVGSDKEIIDPDAVIIEEVPAVPAEDEAPGVPAGDEASGVPAGDKTPGAPAGGQAPPAPPGDEPSSGPAGADMAGDPEKLHEQWAAIQSTFVDDPRGSVAAAAEFMTETIAALVASVQEREHALRGEWDRDGVDTEGLRNALRSYRGLLDQLVRR